MAIGGLPLGDEGLVAAPSGTVRDRLRPGDGIYQARIRLHGEVLDPGATTVVAYALYALLSPVQETLKRYEEGLTRVEKERVDSYAGLREAVVVIVCGSAEAVFIAGVFCPPAPGRRSGAGVKRRWERAGCEHDRSRPCRKPRPGMARRCCSRRYSRRHAIACSRIAAQVDGRFGGNAGTRHSVSPCDRVVGLRDGSTCGWIRRCLGVIATVTVTPPLLRHRYSALLRPLLRNPRVTVTRTKIHK